MRLTLSRKVVLMLGVPLALQVALLGLLAWTHRAHTAALDDAARSKEAVSEADRVLRLTIDAETGVRGYVLTGDPEFTEPYLATSREMPVALARLRELSTEQPGRREAATGIEESAGECLQWMEQTADLAHGGQLGAAEERVRGKEGKHLTDDLRSRVAVFRDAENTRSVERAMRTEATRRWVAGLWIIGTATTVVLTTAMGAYFWRRVGRRLAVLAIDTHRLAAGQPLLPPLSGDDELSRLDQAFRYMADQLTSAANKLRKSAAEVHALYNEAPCGYHSLDESGAIVAINDTELRWLGYDRNEVVGRKRLDEFMTEPSRQWFAIAFSRLKEDGIARDLEYDFIRKDGTVLSVLVNSTAVLDERGNFRSTRAATVDVTARKRAETAVRLFAEVVRNIPIGVIVYQLDRGDDLPILRLRSMNGAASALLGIELEPAIGQEITQVFPSIPEAHVRQFREVAESGKGVDLGEVLYGDQRVSERWWSVLAFPLPEQCVGVAFQDVTARKRIEAEVRRLNEGLEAAVRARTAELAEANLDLVQKNAENEMFVYSVSHDLRSPLVNLQGFSKELGKACASLATLLADERVPADVRQSCQSLLDGKMSKSLGFIQAAVLRLGNIIDALLRLSRAGRVEYRLQEVDVHRLVARIIAASQGTIAEKRVSVRIGALPPAWGDPTALEQVFANLIGNALTYLDPARPGVIEVGGHLSDETVGEHVTYFVRDNGLGIPAAQQHKVFQVFQRAHPTVGSGEGMGLAIVSRVVERHRGRTWVESREGEGSSFFVRLPLPGGGDSKGSKS